MIFSARLKGGQKKWRLEIFIFPRYSKWRFELKNSEYAVKKIKENWKNRQKSFISNLQFDYSVVY